MPKEMRTVYYQGDVQGVGFRYTACRVADRHEVAGYVRNLSDGRVECVVEGERTEIIAFLSELRELMAAYISDIAQTTSPYAGSFAGFTVRR